MRTKIQRNFTLEELSCPCGRCKPVINSKFIDRLQCLRDAFGKPFNINSWYRCKVHNEKVGGKINSKHLLGLAVDISTKGWSSEDKYQLLHLAFCFGFTGIAQGKNFIHIDLRESGLATWTY